MSIGSLMEDDVMVMMAPDSCFRIVGSTARIIRTALMSVRLKPFSQSSSEKLSNLPGGGPPAFTTSPSIRPKSSRDFETHSSIDPASDASIWYARVSALRLLAISEAAASIRSRVLLAMETRAPSRATASAIPNPKPAEEAATRMTLSFSFESSEKCVVTKYQIIGEDTSSKCLVRPAFGAPVSGSGC